MGDSLEEWETAYKNELDKKYVNIVRKQIEDIKTGNIGPFCKWVVYIPNQVHNIEDSGRSLS